MFIQLCDSSDGSRVPTCLQLYVVAWAQQAELLFIIQWWLFIAERQHLRCSVCPVFVCVCAAPHWMPYLGKNEIVSGGAVACKRDGNGLGACPSCQNTALAPVFPPRHFVRFESA